MVVSISNRLKRIISRIINIFYFTEYLYWANIIEKYSYINNELSFIELDLEILNEMIMSYPAELDLNKYSTIKKRLSSVNECTYIVSQNNEICGYYNIAYNNTKELCANVIINVPKDSIYLFDDYTFIKHRGKGAHKFSILSRLNIGKTLGRKYAYVAIFSGNIFSEKAYEKFLFRRIKKYSCFRIGRMKKSIEKVL